MLLIATLEQDLETEMAGRSSERQKQAEHKAAGVVGTVASRGAAALDSCRLKAGDKGLIGFSTKPNVYVCELFRLKILYVSRGLITHNTLTARLSGSL